MEQLDTVSDQSGAIRDYSRVGHRVERLNDSDATWWDFDYGGETGVPNAPEDFSVKQIVGITGTRVSNSSLVDAWEFRRDRSGNKTLRTNRVDTLSHQYAYDAANRLVNSFHSGGGQAPLQIGYTLDGVHNRTDVTEGPDAGDYTMDPLTPEPADFQMNQYSRIPSGTRLYDFNGNLTRTDNLLSTQKTLSYDFKNRMVQHVNAATGQTTLFRYDALGRRIAKIADATGTPAETRYFYAGQHVVEERDAANVTRATYVWGSAIDELISMKRDGTDSFFHGDDLGNIVVATDTSGIVVERYRYRDFGQPQFFNGGGTSIAQSAIRIHICLPGDNTILKPAFITTAPVTWIRLLGVSQHVTRLVHGVIGVRWGMVTPMLATTLGRLRTRWV